MGGKQSSRVVFGLILVLLGVALLARQMDFSWAPNLSRMWPVVFFAIAAGSLANTDGRMLVGRAMWFTFLGTIFLLHTCHVVSLRVSWPLFIVAAGVSMLMEHVACRFGHGRAKGN